MNKSTYMNALRLALEGLPAEVIEQTMWEYESKFVDGMVAGQSEEEIASHLPKPGLLAAQRKASTRYQNLQQHVTLNNIASLIVALIGLAVFNFFMMIPAVVYFSLLMSSYAVALALYVAGIAFSAAAISGVEQFTVHMPPSYQVAIGDDSFIRSKRQHGGQVRVEISEAGIYVDDEDKNDTRAAAATAADASEVTHVEFNNQIGLGHAWHGVGILLGSILLMMFNLLITKYTFIGFGQYLRWNLSMLRVHQPAH